MEKEKNTMFEEIQRANETIRTTNIKGKEYAEVNQRIKAFRMVYPMGTIKTEMIQNENGVCIFRATILDNEKLLATGTAYEKENSTFINKTSYIENCETSAIGRALGIAGFGIDTSVASAEEVQNAIANQETNKKEQEEILKLMNRMNELVLETRTDYEDITNHYEVESTSEMTLKQLKDCVKNLEEKKRRM
jgi:hypothetical protein